jgi:aminoglycoside 2''-phosphotransferase
VKDPNQLDRLAGQVAGFLRALNSLSAAALDLPQRVYDTRDDWAVMYASIRDKLFPAMREDARQIVSQHFEIYLDNFELHRFDPVVRHGDFGGPNVLYDSQMGTICGVIDWSSCALGDPAADLASISHPGNLFFSHLLAHYEPEESRRVSLLARAKFICGTYALIEALDGLRDGDDESYQHGMEAYR